MPGRYSHSVVLADYSSYGVISPASDQLLVYVHSLAGLPPVLASRTVTPDPLVNSGARSPIAISSAPKTHLSSVDVPIRQTKPESIGCDKRGQSQHHTRQPRPRRLVLGLEKDIHAHAADCKDSQSHPPNLVRPRLSSDIMSTTSDPYTEKEVCSSWRDSQVPGSSASEGANVSRSLAKHSTSRSRKFQPRDDVESFQQFRNRGTPLSSTLGHNGERLLSVQEFLNTLPSMKEEKTSSGESRSTFTSCSLHRNRQLPQSPLPQHKGANNGYASSKRPSMYSFRDNSTISVINSSDEDDGIAQITPSSTVRPLTSNLGIRSKDTSRRRRIMDLTEELHILTSQNGSESRLDTQPMQARRVEAKSGQLRTKQTSIISDIDDSELSELDGLEIRPLPRLSTLSKLRSNDGGRLLPGQDPLFEIPDDQLSPLTPHSVPSLDPAEGAVTISNVKPDLLQSSNRGRPGGDYFSRPTPKDGYMYRSSNRDGDRSVLKGESQAGPAVNSPASRASRGRMETIRLDHHMRNNSNLSDYGTERSLPALYGPHTRNRLSALKSIPSFSTPIDSQAAAAPVLALRTSKSRLKDGIRAAPFGVPSIVRSPERKAAINAEMHRRSTATPRRSTSSDFQARSATTTPDMERKHLRHRLLVMGSRNVSLPNLAVGSSRFESKPRNAQTPTKLKSSMTTVMHKQAGQTRTLPKVQTSKAASLSAPSLGHLLMNPPAHHDDMVNHDSALAFTSDDRGGWSWSGRDRRDPRPPVGIERRTSNSRAVLHQGPEEAEVYDNDEMNRFRDYEGEEDDDNDDNDTMDQDAALPPPNVSRYRRSSTGRGHSLDGARVETIFRVLQDGPPLRGTSRVGQSLSRAQDVIQEPMPNRHRRLRSRKKSILGLFTLR